MTTIELIVHAYAEKLDCFAKLLTMQLSSLAVWPCQRARVIYSVCWTASDKLVYDTINAMAKRFESSTGPYEREVEINSFPMDKEMLFRRAIGRNLLARQSKADVVWFTDCDYAIGDGCLDGLADAYQAGFPAKLVFPKTLQIHKSHRIGDELLRSVVPGELYLPDLSQFIHRREKFAIGGLQIVSGDTARSVGYCDGTIWIKPVSEEGGFRNTTEDRVYRAILGESKPIEIPGLYRLRHSESAFEDASSRLAQTEDVR